jgi:hypothetical protein
MGSATADSLRNINYFDQQLKLKIGFFLFFPGSGSFSAPAGLLRPDAILMLQGTSNIFFTLNRRISKINVIFINCFKNSIFRVPLWV